MRSQICRDRGHHGRMHRNLVHGFFRNASGMLEANGEIHVSHKTTAPFSQWKIQELAVWNSLFFIECVIFKVEDYPGYEHKRGSGVRCDEPFPLRKCSTFKFILPSAANEMVRAKQNLILPKYSHQQPQVIPDHIPQHPSTFVLRQQQPDSCVFPHPPGIPVHIPQDPSTFVLRQQQPDLHVVMHPPIQCKFLDV
ncbi:hypothetical protein RJ639_015753 [Escallonia herrerae]|uniref:25S rRNA (uridine-N(3))-methyltransferase BMT5-like domain-containing protein n=1 Tax=Escallonia herrerae TaxID=1293975 RepID=A0AA88VFH9_9ASTE|nr:hypothetical protein RJ639_015753 [Escallonia herrerae]